MTNEERLAHALKIAEAFREWSSSIRINRDRHETEWEISVLIFGRPEDYWGLTGLVRIFTYGDIVCDADYEPGFRWATFDSHGVRVRITRIEKVDIEMAGAGDHAEASPLASLESH